MLNISKEQSIELIKSMIIIAEAMVELTEFEAEPKETAKTLLRANEMALRMVTLED